MRNGRTLSVGVATKGSGLGAMRSPMIWQRVCEVGACIVGNETTVWVPGGACRCNLVCSFVLRVKQESGTGKLRSSGPLHFFFRDRKDDLLILFVRCEAANDMKEVVE